jgi:demethylmenaquinone methyltransferase/2-methoxy-6-polyprenyl-1,4-benzoquinol methylase
MHSDSDVTPAVLAPHPVLPGYYREEKEKRGFVRKIFNETAGDYDRVERIMALGTGSWYRRKALLRAGLRRGMRVLDVATGTGLVAYEEVAIVEDPKLVIGVDPSSEMLLQGKRRVSIGMIAGVGEQLPLVKESFDFLSMGYALRHLSDVSIAFREFLRVLKPGGKVCILEITRPKGKLAFFLMRSYMRYVVPWITRLTASPAESSLLWQYYWDTIEACISPKQVMETLSAAGFVDVAHHKELGVFSEYTARRP